MPEIEFNFKTGSGGGISAIENNEAKVVPRSVYIQSRDRCLKYMEESSVLKTEYEIYKDFIEELVKKQNK